MGGPPCASCKPELYECNVPYFILYQYCSDQVIMGPEGPITLDLLAVSQAMKDYKIPKNERVEFSTKVRTIAITIFNLQAREAAEKRKASENRGV